MNAEQRAGFFARLQALDPHPRTELEHRTPFELLVAVILSAQATDRSVNLATRELFRVADTPAAIVALGVEGLSRHVRSIGLYQSKARHIVQACEMLLAEHGGEVPRTREALERLPGVGRKTANVVLNVAFGEPTIAVDTHVFRVANRTGLAPGRTPIEVERALLERVPPQFLQHSHHWLILHGRYVCKATRPECWRCPVADLCEHQPKTSAPANARAAAAAPAPASARSAAAAAAPARGTRGKRG